MGALYKLLWCWILLVATAAAAASRPLAATGSCEHPPGFYAKAHYRIAKVAIESPFDYLHSVRDMMKEALTAAGVQPGSEYKSLPIIQGQSAIRARLKATADTLNLPVTINVVVAELQDCHADTSPPSLTVTYLAFVSWFPFTFTHTFESHAADDQDPASAARVEQKKFRFVPQAGYNHSARVFGGLQSSVATPLGAFVLDGIASTSAVILETSQSGQHTWEDGAIRSAEWRAGYRYSDVPAVPGHLTEARLTTQFAANSAPLGSSGAIFRFGGAVSGGYDQSRIPSSGLPPGSPTSNPAGEVKTYLGLSLSKGHQSFKASYGLKFGQATTGSQVDFIKQIVDAAYETRLFPADHHRPIELEARFTGGWIDNQGGIPSVERFYGGNYDQNFLLGDSWQIRAEPFIRSFPQNALNHLTRNASIGGQSFVSANFTLAVTTWHRPLVPAEITSNPDFPGILNGELSSAQKTLKTYWLSKDPSIPGVLKLAPEAIAVVHEASKQFDDIQDSVPDELSDRYDDCSDDFLIAKGLASNLDTKTKPFDRFNAISSLVATDDDGSITRLSACLSDFRSQLSAGPAQALLKQLSEVQDSIRKALGAIDTKSAELKSAQDMAYIKTTVHTLVDEMNFVAISPVIIADAARIGPQPSNAGGGFRYGIGGGIRFTLLDAIRFTGGYAFNPNPRPWEGRGAAFFSLQIVSLFR